MLGCGILGGHDASAHSRPSQSAEVSQSLSIHTLPRVAPSPHQHSLPEGQSPSPRHWSATHARTYGPSFGFPGPWKLCT